ncbi:uncharacterized protein LOC131673921 [Phymastichus coffea]|uniref:uncharacterized protein LOC131673921 n=1 Tax=Phymastichus coffea TaxID=108790 RepID=UPI00273B4AFF|nr:uncharacterized protein LOC131673921 [Phymastichus coffea]
MAVAKINLPSVMETVFEGISSSNRLHVRDRIAGQIFLIDTGADISMLPADPKIREKPSLFKLYAANNSRINTFGESLHTLNLGLQRPIRWNFCIADVPVAIIGVDLLAHYRLLVDLNKRRLIDPLSNIYTLSVLKEAAVHSVYVVEPHTENALLLAEFPEICGSSKPIPPETHDVFHHIIITGPPVDE